MLVCLFFSWQSYGRKCLMLEPACRLDDTQTVLQTVLTKRRLFIMFASRSFLFLAELRPEMLHAKTGM
jgi:hypothetical protein